MVQAEYWPFSDLDTEASRIKKEELIVIRIEPQDQSHVIYALFHQVKITESGCSDGSRDPRTNMFPTEQQYVSDIRNLEERFLLDLIEL